MHPAGRPQHHPARQRTRRRPLPLLAAAAVLTLVLILAAGFVAYRRFAAADTGLRYERASNPARTLVRDGNDFPLAIFTDGARTVVLRGPGRTIGEPATTTATVTTLAVVRLAPRPWRAGDEASAWFHTWFPAARTSTKPDLIDIAMQYGPAGRDQRNGKGLRVAGHAVFGPLEKGSRLESSDFNDYLGVDWTFPAGVRRKAQRTHYGALDCSGFVRVVYGYRSGYPPEYAPPTGKALPRRAVMMAAASPGVLLIPDAGHQITDFDRLQAGDLVFFDADPGDGPAIDHVGIYLGIDSQGRHRFMSSRKTANGPTLGDLGGTSLLDGSGLYAHGFRAARRL